MDGPGGGKGMLHELPMMFCSDGRILHGVFFRARDSLSQCDPSVVVTGSWLNVKEQMATNWARALAARGLNAFVFDFGGWGASSGDLRHLEVPTAKARDMVQAVEFVSSMSFAGPRVGYLGVCASAQYALRAIARGARVASFVSVAGWFHDAASVAPFYGGAEGVERRMARAGAALAEQRRTGNVRMVPAYEAGNERAGMSFEMDYYGNPGRGAVPAWSNEMAEASWLSWLTFNGLAAASDVSVPTLMIHSDGCALPDNARTVYGRLKGPKELAWLSTGTQTDYYDLPEYVEPAADRAADFFMRTLSA
jgi:dienelactone hydrolase